MERKVSDFWGGKDAGIKTKGARGEIHLIQNFAKHEHHRAMKYVENRMYSTGEHHKNQPHLGWD